MNITFQNKVALVTGAASGLGLATATAFAESGAAVVLADCNEKAVQTAARAIAATGHKTLAVTCDVSDDAQVEAMVKQTVATFGRLDAAYNNAGVQNVLAETADSPRDDYDRIMAINLRGVWSSMKFELQQMRAQGSGAIVNCSSLGGLIGGSRRGTYHAAKHGVIGMDFQLVTSYKPRGDQPRAIDELMEGLAAGEKHQVLLGVTGSGKTFTMAKIIEQSNRPALILAHNKTLAAQLYHEFKQFFPGNAVEYFVSYYDYYQPEAYIPAGDLYIEKEATINEELDKLRLSATRSLFERRDAIIVSSVSCIYGLGSPEAYYGMLLLLEKGQRISRKDITRRLVEILYERNDTDFRRGTFRVRGDVIEVFPTYDETAYRIELFGDEIESLSQIDPLFGTVKQKYSRLPIYPKSHYVVQPERKAEAIDSIVKS
jgi:NADP-dependent 3-hydroxy acid dehydrogenase YdfG